MGCVRCVFVTLLLSTSLLMLAVMLTLKTEIVSDWLRLQRPPPLKGQWWGTLPVEGKKDNPKINKFTINVTDDVLNDLKNRLGSGRFVNPMPNSDFSNGFNADYLRKVINYWKTNYKWRAWEKKLNAFNHFVTQIDGLKIHFIHMKPTLKKDQKAKVMLMLHGWPGSVFEFYKVIPQLTVAGFELIIPSLPGYAWSEAAPRPGLDCLETARLMFGLMKRLGHTEQFYVQGGDWGSMVATFMSILRPDLIKGLHTNFPIMPNDDIRYWLNLGIGAYLPSLVLSPEDAAKVYPYTDYMLNILDQSGYLHLQATRPDTIGAALTDSPIGLAAYILEKFSCWTIKDFKNYPDGQLTKKFSLDELLTNIMIYWTSGSVASSMRYYKENVYNLEKNKAWSSQKVTVPVGVAVTPNELAFCPEAWFKFKHTNVIQYSLLERGGHFLAFEEPSLFSKDIINFVEKTERWWIQQADKKSKSTKEL